jgi:hypothetical protein
LLNLGFGRRAIGHRLETGKLHPIHRGVYAVGHRVLSTDAHLVAAVLAAGPATALTHRAAAALHDLRRLPSGPIEVTTRGHARSRPGIKVHRNRLPSDEVTTVRGIPATIVPRTLLDLAAVLPRDQLERAMHEAECRRLWDRLSIPDLRARYPRRRGAATIRAILADGALGSVVTRSELEDRFLAFVDHLGVRRPAVNTGLQAGGRWFEVDCLWPDQRLVVELDCHAAHATRAAFERDRSRDRALQAAGWRVLRLTWRELHRRPNAVAADLVRMLERLSPG